MPNLPSLYQIKPAFQRLLKPVLDACIRAGISANALTAAALVLSAAAGAALWLSQGAHWALLLYPPMLLIRMALNALDGLVARETGTSSTTGMVFNEAADLLADLAMYAPLAVVAGLNPWLVIGFIATGIVAEAAGMLRLYRHGQRAYHGPLGKSDRAAAVGLLTVLVIAGVGSSGLTLYLGLLIALHGVTITNRLLASVPHATVHNPADDHPG
ncbi:MAG: CDP-alcohol phosphatidyltransferase family protein [Pseudomonadota bacterium]